MVKMHKFHRNNDEFPLYINLEKVIYIQQAYKDTPEKGTHIQLVGDEKANRFYVKEDIGTVLKAFEKDLHPSV